MVFFCVWDEEWIGVFDEECYGVIFECLIMFFEDGVLCCFEFCWICKMLLLGWWMEGDGVGWCWFMFVWFFFFLYFVWWSIVLFVVYDEWFVCCCLSCVEWDCVVRLVCVGKFWYSEERCFLKEEKLMNGEWSIFEFWGWRMFFE